MTERQLIKTTLKLAAPGGFRAKSIPAMLCSLRGRLDPSGEVTQIPRKYQNIHFLHFSFGRRGL